MTTVDRRLGVTDNLAIKTPCLVASTTNITLSGTQTVGGVAVTAGNRVLVAQQNNPLQNGIYTAAAATWNRPTDANGLQTLVKGSLVFITNSSQWYTLQSSGGSQPYAAQYVVPDLDNQSWTSIANLASTISVSAFGATLISLASATTAREYLGAIGTSASTTFQPQSINLDTLSSQPWTTGAIITWSGTAYTGTTLGTSGSVLTASATRAIWSPTGAGAANTFFQRASTIDTGAPGNIITLPPASSLSYTWHSSLSKLNITTKTTNETLTFSYNFTCINANGPDAGNPIIALFATTIQTTAISWNKHPYVAKTVSTVDFFNTNGILSYTPGTTQQIQYSLGCGATGPATANSWTITEATSTNSLIIHGHYTTL